ncbi:vreteno [Temnothorax americanus]|uniref:vreteno n=1 Tax=Temnothorax americanus TaxID=1964332 RepID=UPI0040676178
MAYFDGFDGDRNAEQMPVVDRTDTEYMIHVTSLPIELNQDAIRDIFSQYGEITAIFYPRNATWAFVTYGKYRDAELAIRELNNKKPLYLKVSLAKEKSCTKEEQKLDLSETLERPKVVNTADLPPIPNDIKYRNMGRGQGINAIRKHVLPQPVAVPYRYVDYGSSLPSVSQTLDVHEVEVEDSYASTNQLWTRGVITVTPDGKRHVSLGRGYTMYEYPEPYPKIEECISKIYEQRKNGLYEYFEDKLKNGVQNCSVCSTKTTKHCEKCRTYYCSKACQLEDWPRHQDECERIPALVEEPIGGMSSLKINQDVNQTKKTSIPNIINKTATSSDVKLRRPNTINAVQVENSSNMNTDMDKNNTTQDRYSSGQRDNDINVSQTKMTDQPVANVTNTKEFSQHRLRKYDNTNESTNQSRKNNECSPTSSSTDQNRHSRNYRSDSNRASLNNVKDKTYNNDQNWPKKNGFQSDKNSACYNGRENANRPGTSAFRNNSMNNDFYKDARLSKTKFIAVEVIISLGNGEYWINKVEDKSALCNLVSELQDVIKKSRKMQPIIGEVYGVLYGDTWYRAMVISLNPTKVNFIDYGNDKILKKDDETRDIGDLAKAPQFARKIRLTQGTSDRYRNLQAGETISVRMLSIDDKTIIVEVQEQSESLSSRTTESASNGAVKKLTPQKNDKSTIASTVQIPNVLDALADLLKQKAASELQIEGFIQIHTASQKNVYYATLGPKVYSTELEMIFLHLQEDLKEGLKVQADTDYKPKPEELVCGKCSDGWYRGYVSVCPKTSKLSILAIDEARIKPADKILPCPKKYSNIFAFGVMCETNHSAFKLQEDETSYEFTAVLNERSHNQESLKIEIRINSEGSDSEVIQAVVRKPTVNSPLKSGSKVCLTSYRNHYNMFVRSLDEEEVEYYNNVMQTVAQYAQTAPHLTEAPDPQQIVIAPYNSDGNSYRAMVVNLVENDKARIVYIDFGNVDIIDIKDLKAMPACDLLQHGCTRITLKDIPRDVPSNPEVDLYLRNLTGKEVPLVCTYEGTSPKDGVCLTMLTGECVNDKINQLLIPGWKKENDDNTCYMINDIESASLGHVGETVNALILYKEDARTMFVMNSVDVELTTHINDVMPKMLKEYCEKTEYYIPRVNELCLALYEEAWYRAVCLNPKESHTTSEILFIDYGNTESVEHKNIRLMPKDFIVPKTLGNFCIIVDLAPVDSNGKYSKAVQRKIDELTQVFSAIKIKIVELIEDSYYYKVELPEVRDALIKSGLV